MGVVMGYWDDKNNAVVTKSKAFALRIIGMYKHLTRNKIEYVIAKQALRSGTSIGANVREAHRGQTDPDFYAKMNIALKEADETAYWLELLHEGEFIDDESFNSIYKDCDEVICLLVSILKNNYKK
ncbi:MAG: four helix bundle protein [Flexilinea sp.]|nr:four helix bundle protein [Flexilinea sp.]